MDAECCNSEITDQGKLSSERDDIVYGLRLSIYYHRKRERFFRLVDNISKAASLVAISALVASSWDSFGLWIGGISALLTIITFVFDLASGARAHGELAAAFGQLLFRVTEKGEHDCGAKDIASWKAERLQIECKEPPALRGLVQLCQDELDIADKEKVNQNLVSPWRKVSAQLGFGERLFEPGARQPS